MSQKGAPDLAWRVQKHEMILGHATLEEITFTGIKHEGTFEYNIAGKRPELTVGIPNEKVEQLQKLFHLCIT